MRITLKKHEKSSDMVELWQEKDLYTSFNRDCFYKTDIEKALNDNGEVEVELVIV
jgi:hypothetical protein